MLKRSQQHASAGPAIWPVPTLIVGVVMLLIAPWVPRLIPTSAVWSDEDARQYAQASADLHAKAHAGHSHGQPGHDHAHAGAAEEKAAAQAAFDAVQARRDSAARLQSGTQYTLQAFGLVACIVGVWGYLKHRPR